LYEGIKIARQPSEIQNRLSIMSPSDFKEELSKLQIRRGAPKGLLTIRLVFNPSKEQDRRLMKRLEEKAKEKGHDVNGLVKEIILNYLK
jgi:ParB family chromosome partitioning protein